MNKIQNPKSKIQNYKKILIIRLDRIGDVLLSTPVIKALRDSFPKSHIAFMANPYAEDIVRDNPYLDEIIVYNKNGKENGFVGNLKFIHELRKKKFDLALILHPTLRTHLVVFFSAIPERVGYDKKLGYLLTRRIPHTKQFGLKHEIDYTLDLLRYIGIEPAGVKLYMPIMSASDEKIKNIFRENNIASEDIIVTLNPGASCPSKRWSPKNFARVGDALASTYGVKLVIVSDLKDKMFADSVLSSMMNTPLSLAGMTSVSDLASVLKRSRLFISNDSGPVHIASALDVPVIAIFGRSDRGLSPARWRPRGANDIALHKDVGCDICMAHNCKLGFKCLESVTCEDVLNAAEKILKKCA